ncbi:MAG: helix-turn-helix transcriptional regulator [Desulfitobacterium sp.]|nr:helix-turn-helix transcriptional regulator [Desulfitobacterium sp.]
MVRKNNLRHWRLANGMTLIELSQKTGISYKYLNQIEKGLRKGTPNTWLKISKVLKVPPEKFFNDEVKEAGARYSVMR